MSGATQVAPARPGTEQALRHILVLVERAAQVGSGPVRVDTDRRQRIVKVNGVECVLSRAEFEQWPPDDYRPLFTKRFGAKVILNGTQLGAS